MKREGTPSSEIGVGEGRDWHAMPLGSVAADLGADPGSGLSTAEARRRLAQYGPNRLETIRGTPWYQVLARQFVSVLILILLIAAIIALAIGEPTDAATILAIVALNGVLGFVQEWKAERAIEALQRMLSPRCTVKREGLQRVIEAENLVLGDMVLLKTGDRVAADLRLFEALNLQVDESSLTGESESVMKQTDPVSSETPLAERASVAWMGTAVTNGRGSGVVVATGMGTEFGRIAKLTQAISEEATPLQLKLAVLGRQLGVFAVGVSVAIGIAGWLFGRSVLEMFLTAVSLAVAVVPEGLPAVVTITLALGIRAMAQRRALLRRLQAAETLGAATVICTDKTGTLTQNQMTIQQIWLPSGELKVTGVGYEPVGDFMLNGEKVEPRGRSDLSALLETALSCNHARIYEDQEGWHEVGEPTEAALVVAAAKAGLYRGESEARLLTEFSFSSGRKRMTIVSEDAQGKTAHVKGAPEVILERCRLIFDGGSERELTKRDLLAATEVYQSMAGQGLRTLALGRRSLPDGVSLEEDSVERDLTLLGIVGIIDPPRPEVPQAVRLAGTAGIRVIMITGDAPATGLAIARRVGLPAGRAVSGSELAAMADRDLGRALDEGALFARATPEHKLRIVSLLQQAGEVVGMTGDGVNDAPALKKSDIGIAMGLRGTDVAKGAADMVLTDDNFASIINAVEEGRRQYDNIQKFVRYLLSSNTAEVLAIFINVLVGGPLILLPVQILWMNLVTDGLTAVALGVEPAEKGVMRRPPRAPTQPILDRSGILVVALLGMYMAAGTLWLFHHYREQALAQTVAFTGIILLEKMNVFNFRALREPLSVVGFFSNSWLLLAWTLSVGLQLSVVYIPFLQEAFHTAPLGWSEWGAMLAVAAPVFLLTEAFKMWRWRQAS